MSQIDENLKKIEAATSGKDIRTELIAALKTLNGDVSSTGKTYDSIGIENVNKICTR